MCLVPGQLLTTLLEFGCYLDAKDEPTHGKRKRESVYLRWESKASSYASRGPYLFLFSTNYIEIRTIDEGHLVQVLEGEDIRLVHADHDGQEILVAKKGYNGAEVLVELVTTKRFRSTHLDHD